MLSINVPKQISNLAQCRSSPTNETGHILDEKNPRKEALEKKKEVT
jgi:hypothetical protein